ncbi:unnamed protein product [Sphagnum balticum]
MLPGWLLSSSSLLRDSGGLRLRKLRGSLEHGALISLLVTTVTVAALLLLRSCSANSEGRGGPPVSVVMRYMHYDRALTIHGMCSKAGIRLCSIPAPGST